MRKILYRGKSTSTHKWIYGYYHYICGCHLIAYDFCKEPIGEPVIPESVGQFTGLTDLRGRKVFEGDIVEIEYAETIEKGVICYQVAGFYLKNENGELFEIDNYCYIKILGKIHDNPELLKGERK